MSGLNHIVGRTCMRFKTRTTETDYVRVFQGSGCYSYVGRIGGRQDLSLGNGCVFMGTIVHEVIHAIGFYHEQSRSDRDNYVIINWENIAEGQQHNFDKFEDTMVSPFNVPYDYSSVMHYSRTAFSKNGLDTITVKSGAEIGHRSAMSNLDWTKVNNMYCPNTLGIRIINAGDNLYLQGAGPSSEGVAVIASSFQKEDHQLWTVHYGRLHTQTGSTIVPWSQDGGSVKYMVENSSSNVLIASNTTQSREMWMVRPVNPPAPNPHQIVNVASGLCLYSRGSLQARTGNCNVNDISQIWNIYQA
ncbi:zinc metalloproteinase nas-13-like [Bradysia coprophila]|uniref:zinc metalloproteinase nas-13-like n=1 Tax=Bradysia coprophila TaxID=38358 RepID=UPI00187DD03C|nr:zinc metalloproteinase nas-13-like [Bradysia coprophila]